MLSRALALVVVDDGGLGEELGRVHDARGGGAGRELVLGLFLSLVLATVCGIEVCHEGRSAVWGDERDEDYKRLGDDLEEWMYFVISVVDGAVGIKSGIRGWDKLAGGFNSKDRVQHT